jgi:hypothetical protein
MYGVEMPLPHDQPVTQEIHALVQRHHLGLPLAQPQPEPRKDLSCPRQRVLRSGLGATGQSHVVRVPHVAHAFRIEHLIQPGQVMFASKGLMTPPCGVPALGRTSL